ncbi:toll/interleukin-1 receptor domain-containing protein [Leptolyngbya sp. CCNP1308]|uniref:toll/interleukin-1 receptor domain-containing protein n=1 Tax=Leptolyngbya sp. CCNP1308 TaxID=3110255 RepID=UPI002B1EBC7F|nr:toll/interleukin-1 receptor domain-containing protein [Leptolyngbya sp. CCNP1308]MEA5447629.1 toll/interleukin-1 receptor domain-containing protein [Leptolyngbya sp. CCNP1308]
MDNPKILGYSEIMFSTVRSNCGGEGVFICYRTVDTAGHAGRLYDHLKSAFGKRKVFFDKEGFHVSQKITPHTKEILAKCSALLVLIGRHWLRKNDGSLDYVIEEIKEALRIGLPIIPLFFDGAQMPSSAEIPNEIKDLTDILGFEIRNNNFLDDVNIIIDSLKSENTNRGKCPVILKRNSQFAGSSAIYKLEVDGVSIGSIVSGGCEKFFVDSGSRKLRISHYVPFSSMPTPSSAIVHREKTYYSNEINVSLTPDVQVGLYCYSNWRMKLVLEKTEAIEYYDELDIAYSM